MQSEAAAGVSKAKHFPGQTVRNSVPASEMGERSSSDSKKKGPWTREEDQKLIAYIQEHGFGSWRTLPSLAGLQRCGKSCRLRWTNYLRPDIIRGKISSHEEKTIIRLHALLGNRWSAIAAHLPKRTDNEIKNYWNTRLKKRLTRMGIDPATHKPKLKSKSKASSSLTLTQTHTAQWEEARLQAEARLRAQARRPPPPCLDVLKVWQLIHHPQQLQFDPAIATTTTPNFPLAAPVPNQYACGAGLGQLDCYADVMQQVQSIPASYDGTELMGVPVQVEQLNQECCGEFEDDKSFWNYLLNLVSSPIMESSPSPFPVLY